MRPTTKLRQIMAEKKTIIKPGTYDAMSAKIMEICGFKAIGISGYSISVTYLGKPDLGFVSLTELAAICRNIASTVSIPVIADADTGFGNAINVLYTTDLLIKTGIAAFHIEDQEFPKRCGHVGGKKVIATEEMVGKIKAAAKVRDEMDKDFVIIARSDVRGVRNGT
ncbi:MAG: isocitrate lyase/PEP mutase family protein, partial [Synergistaceae bacterium]|nr:isocitrate lyase/PEP mutase family protein [Synergistaceae bacterium]